MATPTSRPDVPTSTLPAPQPTHPVAGQTVTEAAPEFRWITLPDVDSYRLQVAASDSFETIFHDEVVDGPLYLEINELLPQEATSGAWRVRTEGDDEAPWSTPATFVIGKSDDSDEPAQFLVDAPPVPIRPIQGDTVKAEGATLTWEGVPEASGYRVQVASTSEFDDPIVDVTLDQTTTLTLFESLPSEEEPIYWRLRALFPNDTGGPWSDGVYFGTDPDLGGNEGQTKEEERGETRPSSVRRSPVAAGPARHGRTSNAAAVGFIGVLLISFLITILLVMWAL